MKEEAILFLFVVSTVKTDRNQIWNSTGLSNLCSGNQSSSSDAWKDCWIFMKHLSSYFNGSLESFHAWDNAKLVCFKYYTRGVLKSRADWLTNYVFENVSRTIHAECKVIPVSSETYDVHINPRKSCSQPLETTLTKYRNSLFSALIGNIDTSFVKTEKGITLRILFCHLKYLNSTFDQGQKFKKFATAHSAKMIIFMFLWVMDYFK